jgi:hypothetical protein
MKLAKQYPNHAFFSKKSVINYMTKALANEMRQAVRVNLESFRFKLDDEVSLKEKYLGEIEHSKDISPAAQLRRKIAAVFDRNTAYQLLTSCKFPEPKGNFFEVKLLKDIAISESIKVVVLEQVQAVYGEKIVKLEIIPLAQTSQISQSTNVVATETYDALNCLDSKSVWFKVRKFLIECYGAATDKSWFSKLEIVNENTASRKVTLKPSTAFIGDWLRNNYGQVLKQAFQMQNFTFEII